MPDALQVILQDPDGPNTPVGADNPFPMVVSGKMSTANSTTTLLGAGETVWGVWETNNLEQVMVNAAADQAGTLRLQVSPDGGETITFDKTFTVRASTFVDDVANHPVFKVLVKGAGRSFRFGFTNGATPQGRFVLKTIYGSSLYPYSASPTGELLVTTTEQEKNVFAAAGRTVSTTGTEWSCVVDLSDVDGYGHAESGYLAITHVVVTIDKSTNARGSVALGVITRINGTDADVTLFAGVPFSNSDAQRLALDRNYAPSQIKTLVSNGTTPYINTTGKLTGVEELNTGILLDSKDGTEQVTPAVGDLVARYDLSAGTTATGAVQVLYHGEE